MSNNSNNDKTWMLNAHNNLFYEELVGVFLFLVISILVAFLIIALSYYLSNKNPEVEKLSTYECGFEPYEDARNTFDVKFFLVAILFLIFDIETLFLFPWTISVAKLDLLGFWSMFDFLIELNIGLLYVWYKGGLDWE